ncbi:MAG: MRP family ATP-binding protein [Calditrichaeota bacterium]|nr:MAG: MRP family ATP-binding protein [Calditrichota bacterium]MBL1206419.1 MRP family ATP-binding protein [Calditrichota bacterium]NOG46245.1 Mrp/NBP35 family ATP-binding protein [Calditrichota bacterium]
MPGKQEIIDQLKEVNYPGFSRDIVSFGVVNDVVVEDSKISVIINLKSQDPKIADKVKQDVESHLKKKNASVEVEAKVSLQQAAPAPGGAPQMSLLKDVKHKVAVASGKGGVGKSTVAVNLAVALAKQGLKVGLLDADIYGPSIPLMLGVDEQPKFDGQKLIPIEKYGVKLMSLGFLVDSNDPVIWRGALVTRALQQLMTDVDWGDLDIMLFDMPPGTGDAQLTLSQSVALDGAIIVSTPQDVALADAVKGVQMFRKVNVPILGVIENMSYFVCAHCGGRHEIFDHGGVERECKRIGADLLGEIPLDSEIRIGGDKGTPVVSDEANKPQAIAFMEVAKKVSEKLNSK